MSSVALAEARQPLAGPSHYSLAQIVLHWAIAALVLWQLFLSEAPNEVMRMTRRGLTPSAVDTFLSGSHVYVGFAILALVILRLILRLRRPTPLPAEPNPALTFLAKAAHNLFYVLLFFMPVTGILSWYFRLPTGDIHELGKLPFIGLIGLHVLATAWHQLIRRDNGLRRMLVPARD